MQSTTLMISGKVGGMLFWQLIIQYLIYIRQTTLLPYIFYICLLLDIPSQMNNRPLVFVSTFLNNTLCVEHTCDPILTSSVTLLTRNKINLLARAV